MKGKDDGRGRAAISGAQQLELQLFGLQEFLKVDHFDDLLHEADLTLADRGFFGAFPTLGQLQRLQLLAPLGDRLETRAHLMLLDVGHGDDDDHHERRQGGHEQNQDRQLDIAFD